jgi:hypothetical protein
MPTDDPLRAQIDRAADIPPGRRVRAVLPNGRVALWSVTSSGGEPSAADRAEQADWDGATLRALADLDPALDAQLAETLVDALFEAAGLSPAHRSEGLEQVHFHVGTTPKGVQFLRATLPLGEGAPMYGWGGGRDEAMAVAATMGRVAGETIAEDRRLGWPTGWEPDPDDGPPAGALGPSAS